MNDLVTKLSTYLRYRKLDPENVEDMNAVAEEIIKMVEAEREWISVKDRLPETHTEEDICVSDTVFVNWQYYDYDEHSKNFGKEWEEIEKAYILDDKWVNFNDEEIKIDDPGAPTHWMPLPKLPEVEK